MIQDDNSDLLPALPQVSGMISQSQRLLKSKRQLQANRRNSTNLLNAKVFTLHPVLRNVQIPPGGQRELMETYCEHSRQCSDLQKSAVTFWFTLVSLRARE